MVDFLKVFGPTVRSSGLGLNIVCCDASGWTQQRSFSNAIEADATARQYVDVHSGHTYSSKPTSPLLTTTKPVWMSEYGLGGSTWNTNWDSGEAASAGFVLANDIHDT